MENFGVDSLQSFLYLETKYNILKIDLTKDDKLIMNSLGAVIGKETKERVLAAEIKAGIISLVRAQRTTFQTFEEGGMTFSQELEITVLELSYDAQIDEQ